ncbi:ankyrin repeat domain-containing protein [Candidatus Babeliales bacterium]|nr:ankyrin repeat domain-containing protein [Candidatus Babeliales bacterium]
MFFLSMLLLAMVPSLFAESHKYGSHKKALAVQQVQVFKQDTDLIKAVKTGNIKAVKQLLKHKNVDLNQLDTDNKTALDLAVEYQHKKIVVLLAKAGGKVTSMDNAESVNKAVIRSGSNMFKRIFSLLCVAVGVGLIILVGLLVVDVVITAWIKFDISVALFCTAIGCCVDLPLAYLVVCTIVRRVDSLRDIKNNNLAEFYII